MPGDSERKIAKGLECAADALILDLEDSVAPDRKRVARELCRAALAAGSAVVEAFAAADATGVTVLDGKMLDRPHHRAALRVLDAAG